MKSKIIVIGIALVVIGIIGMKTFKTMLLIANYRAALLPALPLF